MRTSWFILGTEGERENKRVQPSPQLSPPYLPSGGSIDDTIFTTLKVERFRVIMCKHEQPLGNDRSKQNRTTKVDESLCKFVDV